MNQQNKKMKKRRIIIPALSVLAVASMVGSLAGTVAWYQYSTRVTASVAGTDASTYGNLQLAFGSFKKESDSYGFKSGEITDPTTSFIWKTDAKTNELAAYIGEYREKSLGIQDAGNVQEFKPVTAKMKGDGSIEKFYSNPVYQYNELNQWNEASVTDYITFPLTLRLASNATSDDGYPVYLQDLRLQSSDTPLSKALRVQYSSQAFVKDTSDTMFKTSGEVTNLLLSEEGGETLTYGPLDLNADGLFDSPKNTYDFDEKSVITYGENGSKQTSFKQADIAAKDDGQGKLTENEDGNTKPLGTIPQDGYLQVNVTIWLEGWHVFSSGTENATNPVTVLKNGLSAAEGAVNTALTDYNQQDDAKKKALENTLAAYKEAFEDYMNGVDALPNIKEALKKADSEKANAFKAAKDAFVGEVKGLTVETLADKDNLDAALAALSTKSTFDAAKDALGFNYDELVAAVSKESSLWDTSYIGKSFNVGMTFAVSNF